MARVEDQPLPDWLDLLLCLAAPAVVTAAVFGALELAQ